MTYQVWTCISTQGLTASRGGTQQYIEGAGLTCTTRVWRSGFLVLAVGLDAGVEGADLLGDLVFAEADGGWDGLSAGLVC